MARTQYFRFSIRGGDNDLIFEVRKPEVERRESVLSAEGRYADRRVLALAPL